MTLHQLELRLRQATDSIWGAMFGAAVYAAWAIAVNWDAGLHIALKVGLAHWLTSTFLTYTGTGVMRQFFSAATSKFDGALLAFVSGLCFTYAVLIGVHHAVGTPHLLLTLAAGVIPNVLFCSSYALLLARTMPARGADAEGNLI